MMALPTMKILRLSFLSIVILGRYLSLSKAEDTSFARPAQLNVTTSFYSSPRVLQLLRNHTLSYALLSAPNAAANFWLLLHTYNGNLVCSAALLNATSYIMWMRPCPPLAYRNCTLTFNAAGELILASDGVVRWSSKTSSKGVSGMRVTNKGELQILNKNNESVWNSDSDPTASSCLAEFEPTALPPAIAACAPVAPASSNSYNDSSASSDVNLAAGLMYSMLMSVVVHGLLL